MPNSDTDRYAYGLRVRGLDHVTELARAGPADDWPTVVVRSDPGRAPSRQFGPDGRRCVRRLADGRWMSVDRQRATATLHGVPPSPDLLAHPYLAAVSTVVNRWSGRETFHSGAFTDDGRAWAVLGARTAGKSSLLALLAAAGVPVLADDVLVTDGRSAFAGPRCLDLREPVPGVGLATVSARYATRLRVALPPVPDQLPLGGWFFLRWGDVPSVDPVPATELLGRLAALRTWPGLPSDPTVLLALASLPAWDLVRPRGWALFDETRRLLDLALAGAAAVTS